MVFPLIVTDVGILMTLFMSPYKYEERIGSLITVLLALFAFLNFARSALPDVPVSTWLDYQIFQSVTMSLLGMLETIIVKYEYGLAPEMAAKALNTFELGGTGGSTAQLVARILRVCLVLTVIFLMLKTMMQIALRMHRYYQRVGASERATSGEMKKRSTDFDASDYGLRAFADMEAHAVRSVTTKPPPSRRSTAKQRGSATTADPLQLAA